MKGNTQMGAQLQGFFRAAEYDPTQGAGQMPLGKHPVIITDSVTRANSSGQGGLVEFSLSIIDGPNKGQTGAYRLNLYHQNPQTVEIAHRQLSALCYVCGVMELPNDCSPLHNRPFVVEVTPQKLTPEQTAAQAAGQSVQPYTQVSKVYYMDGREPGKEGQAAGPAQTMQAQPPQQQPQQPQQPAAGAWGAQGAQGGPAPAPQPQQGGAGPVQWGNPPAGAAPAPAPAQAGQWGGAGGAAPAPAAGGQWSQGAPAGGAGKPNWGR